MKIFRLFIILTTLLVTSGGLIAQQETSFQYVSPKPNSIMVSNETNIILRHETKLHESTIIQSLISVVGSTSGTHTGDFLLTDDEQTIVFNPHKSFAHDEVVTVSVQQGIKTITDFEVQDYSFSFETEKIEVNEPYSVWFDEDLLPVQNPNQSLGGENVNVATLPAPPITIDSLNNPGPGYIFIATWDRNVPQLYGNFIFIETFSQAILRHSKLPKIIDKKPCTKSLYKSVFLNSSSRSFNRRLDIFQFILLEIITYITNIIFLS